MKSIVVLFAGAELNHAFDKVFDSESAFFRCMKWSLSIESSLLTFVLVCPSSKASVEALVSGDDRFRIIEKSEWTSKDIARTVSDCCAESGADFALYSWADCPFINKSVTDEIIKNHTEYKAEYTFADGYPYGVSPEAVDSGACAIIAAVAESSDCAAGGRPASRDSLFSIMKGDINSFEIETVIAEKDFRMLRYEFECSSKSGVKACTALYSAAAARGLKKDAYGDYNLIDLCTLASETVSVMHTVPSFYNIQISGKYNHNSVYCPYRLFAREKNLPDMALEDFKKLVRKISEFSEKAVISLSCFGEALLHPYFADFIREIFLYPGLSVFIETDGLCVTDELAEKTALYSAGKIDWAVCLDGTDSLMYRKINEDCSDGDFETAVKSVSVLEKYFDGRVYPQFTRMKLNECQLESFFRFWKKDDSASKGRLIIQKYDSFCSVLKDEKSADLSPLNRIPCWHLRRDMSILSNGDVILCRDQGIDAVCGNVFNENLDVIWNRFETPLEAHVKGRYPEKCRNCDEYYTFNF